jgi:hypothetical protein
MPVATAVRSCTARSKITGSFVNMSPSAKARVAAWDGGGGRIVHSKRFIFAEKADYVAPSSPIETRRGSRMLSNAGISPLWGILDADNFKQSPKTRDRERVEMLQDH